MTPLIMLWGSPDTSLLSAKVYCLVERNFTGKKLYASVQFHDLDSESLSKKLAELYRSHIPLSANDTRMHIAAVIPLWDKKFTQTLDTLTKGINGCGNNTSLHVIALKTPLARVLGIELDKDSINQEHDSADRLVGSKENPQDYTCTLLDDYINSGAAINFTINSLADYLSIFAGALIRNYYAILNPSVVTSVSDGHVGIGISSLRFDKKDAVDFLLHRALVTALDKENIMLPEVDSQRAMHYAQNILKGIGEIYETFYNNDVMDLYRGMHQEASKVAAEVKPLLEKRLNILKEKILRIISDATLSLPEKEAILALVLGRDNRLLSGIQYTTDSLLLDDVSNQPLDLLIDIYNKCASGSNLLPDRGSVKELCKYVYDTETKSLVPSKINLEAFNPLPDIKRLKQDIYNNTAFIRRQTDEYNALLETEKSRQSGEEHPGNKRIAGQLPEIKEQPLDEVYIPSASPGILPSVDLRKFFSPVKSQSDIGACSTFAIVAIYESIINRSTGRRDADLSERFVYFYSNVVTGYPEGGSNYYDQLKVLGTHGVCEEKMCPFSTGDIGESPSQKAIDNGVTHRVLSAKEVRLRNSGTLMECITENHRMLTSALSEGFPVGIALKVYDSFGVKGPYIHRPTEEDIATGGKGMHAMVLTGYSEKDKLYIVRNSWGPDWGDQGYSYISAAYIDDPEYNHYACIITDTTEGKAVHQETPGLTGNFSGTENELRIAALRNVLDEAHVELQSQQRLYRAYYTYYASLTTKASMPSVQRSLRQLAEEKSREELQMFMNAARKRRNTLYEKIKNYRNNYLKILLVITGVAVLSWSVILTTDLIESMWCWGIAGVTTAASVIMALNYPWAIRRIRRKLKAEIEALDMAAEQSARELDERNLQFHVAGMWMNGFNELKSYLERIHDMLSKYNSALRVWHEEDSSILRFRPVREGENFHYLGSSDLYEKYFAKNADDIASQINLSEAFTNACVSGEPIERTRERLLDCTGKTIRKLFDDFSMTELLTGRNYPYIGEIWLSSILGQMLIVGNPSVRYDIADPQPPLRLIFIDADDEQRARFRNKVSPYFPYVPTLEMSDDPTTLDMITIQPVSIRNIIG